MRFSVLIHITNDFVIIKTWFLSLHCSISSILNIILSSVLCIFILCSLRFIRQEKRISIIHRNTSTSVIDEHNTLINLTRTRAYYDFERYLVNNTFRTENKTRRYVYIDLGCFDGRDADHFVHFNLKEILRYGTLNIIAFEPDPINFSACQLAQQNRSFIPTIIHNVAVWTEDGQVRYATGKGKESKIDPNSALTVRSIDFSKWLTENVRPEDYVYVKFAVEGAEIAILEKMVRDRTLELVDNMEIEWSKNLSLELEPRRIVFGCMFDNFGMDFIYMINPVDLEYAYNVKDIFLAIPKARELYVLY